MASTLITACSLQASFIGAGYPAILENRDQVSLYIAELNARVVLTDSAVIFATGSSVKRYRKFCNIGTELDRDIITAFLEEADGVAA